jgi:RHS repeat-associated protein
VYAGVTWSIEKSVDRSGNAIQYVYGVRTVAPGSDESEKERWLERIDYGREGKMDRRVELSYDDRPDKRYGFAFLRQREALRRLSLVQMQVNSGGTWKQSRAYKLEYINSGSSKLSKLSKLTECGTSLTECKRPTTFSWTLGNDGFDAGVAQSAAGLVPSSDESQLVTADFSGDGRTDVAWAETDVWKYAYAKASSSGQVFTGTVTAPNAVSDGRKAVAYTLDYDGDGSADLMPKDGKSETSTWGPLISKESGGARKVRTLFTGPMSLNPVSFPLSAGLFGDFNGDGYQDVLQRWSGGSSEQATWTWRAATGKVGPNFDSATDPFDSEAFGPEKPVVGLGDWHADGVIVIDVDGDGRDEVAFKKGVSATTLTMIDFQHPDQTLSSGLPASVLGTETKIADVNGDGLADVIARGSDRDHPKDLHYWLNIGGTFLPGKPMNMGLADGSMGVAQVVDFDSDGRQDLLVPHQSTLPSTAGPAFDGLDVIRSTSGDLSAFTREPSGINFGGRTLSDLYRQGPRIVDVNADGLDDVLMVDRPQSGPAALKVFTHRTISSEDTAKPDMLHEIREGNQVLGAGSNIKPTATFTFAPLTSGVYERGNCPRVQGVSCLAGGPMYVVSQLRRDAGVKGSAGEIVANYTYKNGKVDRKSREFLGFAEVAVSTKATTGSHDARVERSFYSNGVLGKDPRLADRWVISALPDNRQALQRTEVTWADKPTAANASFSYQSKVRTRLYEVGSLGVPAEITKAQVDAAASFRDEVTLSEDVDQYGNVGHRTTQVTGNGVSSSEVTITPDVDTSEWLITRPKKVVTKSSVFNPKTFQYTSRTRTSDFEFDGASLRVKKETRYATADAPGRKLTLEYAYDESGNVERTTSTDGGSGEVREATAKFDPAGFPFAVRNGLGHTSYTGFDPILGVAKAVVDANGLRTDFTFDTLGRLVKTRRPDGFESTMSYSLEKAGDESLVQVELKDGTGAVTQSVSDRAGRTVISRFRGFDSGMRQVDTTFEATGGMTARTVPYPAGADVVADNSTFVYDDLGRLIKQTDPSSDNSGPDAPKTAVQTWAFDKLTATHTDARGTVKKQTSDSRGLTVTAIDGEGRPEETKRTYTYGPFGQITSSETTGVSNSLTTYTYDELGNTETMTDPERGTTFATYNAFGELASSTDAAGRTTTVAHDVLGRETGRSVEQSGLVRSVLTRTFDTDAGRTWKGALLKEVLDDGTAGGKKTVSEYTHDTLGRLKNLKQIVPSEADPSVSETFAFDYGYDGYSRPLSVTYPKLPGQAQGVKVTNVYGPADSSDGSVREVTATDPTAGTFTLWKATTVDDQSRLSTEVAGDGTITSRKMDWHGGVTSQDIRTATDDSGASNKVLWKQSYVYDTEGNLASRTDNSVTQAYTVDVLDRVTKEKTNGVQSDSFTYDTLGNLTDSTNRGTYTYDSSKPTQVTKVTGGLFGTRSYGYDAVGDQTSRPDATLAFNDFHLPAAIDATVDSKDASFLYYPTGERARKTSNSGVTTYVPGLMERQHKGTTTDWRLQVTAGTNTATLNYSQTGTGNASRKPVTYSHTDRLGSTSLVTRNDATAGATAPKATVAETRAYDAFGQVRNPDLAKTGSAAYTTGIQTPAVPQGYTGHNDDPELSLINMTGRIYDPVLARFTTPDPNIDGTNTTQAFNRYTYVSNNPITSTDPTGFQECQSFDCRERARMMWEWNTQDGEFFTGGVEGLSPMNPDSTAGNQIENDYFNDKENHRALNREHNREARELATGTAGDRAIWQNAPVNTQGGGSRNGSANAPMTANNEVAADSIECGPEGIDCSFIADEVTIVGPSIVNDWGRTWCGPGPMCTNDDQIAAGWLGAGGASSIDPSRDATGNPSSGAEGSSASSVPYSGHRENKTAFLSVGYELSTPGPIGMNIGTSLSVDTKGTVGWSAWTAAQMYVGVPGGPGAGMEVGRNISWNNGKGWDSNMTSLAAIKVDNNWRILGYPTSGSLAVGYNQGPWRIRVGVRD